MSDVPAAALWLAALVLVSPRGHATAGAGRGDRRGEIAAGVCASLAVLMRPNVALIVLPLLALLPDRRSWLRFGLYTVFDDWWYIRFLLPALPVLIVLSVAVLLEFARGRPPVRVGAAIVTCAILGAWHLHAAGTHQRL